MFVEESQFIEKKDDYRLLLVIYQTIARKEQKYILFIYWPIAISIERND